MTVTFRRTLAAALILTAAAATPALACSRASVPGAEAQVVPGRINQALVDAAIRAEVNFHRCKAGRPALKAAPGLSHVAETHAKWMARTRTVSHKSSVAGQSTLKARMSTSGIRFRAGSENIGMVHRYAIEGAGGFRIKGACEFTTHSGQPLGAHSYASLARHIVALWMSSPGHRSNILDGKVSMVGSGAALNPEAPNCGQFFVSQNFAG